MSAVPGIAAMNGLNSDVSHIDMVQLCMTFSLTVMCVEVSWREDVRIVTDPPG
ncbi:hypothetical protein EV102420_02_03780 [Pseudescherichia vulneris NBRC 102420]|uniref:Uncharacterized protein n=1 Tax=Pseudescherichia vulneris NBRC 102420 TaxID=1115515 RepID=A0A090UY01_PSEVU|nr:hypothetical protein EV102420_02_03780 [Pseudescherichia vulneris NBRC 102420]